MAGREGSSSYTLVAPHRLFGCPRINCHYLNWLCSSLPHVTKPWEVLIFKMQYDKKKKKRKSLTAFFHRGIILHLSTKSKPEIWLFSFRESPFLIKKLLKLCLFWCKTLEAVRTHIRNIANTVLYPQFLPLWITQLSTPFSIWNVPQHGLFYPRQYIQDPIIQFYKVILEAAYIFTVTTTKTANQQWIYSTRFIKHQRLFFQ